MELLGCAAFKGEVRYSTFDNGVARAMVKAEMSQSSMRGYLEADCSWVGEGAGGRTGQCGIICRWEAGVGEVDVEVPLSLYVESRNAESTRSVRTSSLTIHSSGAKILVPCISGSKVVIVGALHTRHR